MTTLTQAALLIATTQQTRAMTRLRLATLDGAKKYWTGEWNRLERLTRRIKARAAR